MVIYSEYPLLNEKSYKIDKGKTFEGCSKKFTSTVKNLNKMLIEGRPITVIIPERNLTKEESEEYRKHFCSLAKDKGMNFIYFEGPVVLTEQNPFEGTMFE